MQTAVVIPSLGGPHLAACLQAVKALAPSPSQVVLVLSGGATEPPGARELDIRTRDDRLGFASAVNTGLQCLADGIEAVALVNDDAVPEPSWLKSLVDALDGDPRLAAVQGTVTTADGTLVDGRGIEFDRFGLPIQVDHGDPLSDDRGGKKLTAVSGTACIYRMQALDQIAFDDGSIFDPAFDCYHEDLDVGLRLLRVGWSTAWTGNATVRHLGSASGQAFSWRHPWWLLANRWRAVAGNLGWAAMARAMPRLLRGEMRAVRTLARRNLRALPVAGAVLASLPLLVISGMLRPTAGPRLQQLPEAPR